MRTCVVVNPAAGGGWTRQVWPQMRARLQTITASLSIRQTTGPGTATDLTQEALDAGFDRIVAVGGDGTLNEVVNGFFREDAPIRPSAVLAFLPCGSSGDFRHTLDVPAGLEAVSHLERARIDPIDVLRLQFATPTEGRTSRYAINVVSFGLSGPVLHQVRRSPGALPARVRYLGAAVLALATHRPTTVDLTLDHQSLDISRTWLVAIANGTTFAAGIRIAPDATPDDGQLDVTVLRDVPRRTLIRHIPRFYRGTHTTLDGVQTYRGRRLTARLDDDADPVQLEADGELLGRLPLTVEVIPQALRIHH